MAATSRWIPLSLFAAVLLAVASASQPSILPGAQGTAAGPSAPVQDAATGATAQNPAPAGGLHGGPTKDCLSCHEPLKADLQRAFPHKPALEGQCVECHAPHAARHEKLLKARERALCAGCHGEQIAAFMKGSVHTPIKEGQCTSCHAAHGSENEHLLVRTGNELCTGCHKQKHDEASLPFVHDPFANGACLDCHGAHNTPFPDQLTARSANLCRLCHPPEAEELVSAHSGIPVQGSDCTGCHDPHASSSDGLLRAFVHAPFGDKSCEMCHRTDTETPRLVRATGGRLCAVCHKGYPKAGDTVVHAPVGKGECAACHVPHTGDVKGLLAKGSKELCSSCHQPLLERGVRSKSVHPIVDEKGACLGCHAPHSSSEEHLLLAGPIRTCLACHETAKHGHPLGEDRLDPRTNKPITCVTCHDPHGTAFSYNLRGDQSRGLCLECHDTDHQPVKKPVKQADDGGLR
jgi:predicted CXXCH cytochrome family protein